MSFELTLTPHRQINVNVHIQINIFLMQNFKDVQFSYFNFLPFSH